MSWLDALLGRIRSAGVDIAMGNGLNFLAPLTATLNRSSGYIDVTSDAITNLMALSALGATTTVAAATTEVDGTSAFPMPAGAGAGDKYTARWTVQFVRGATNTALALVGTLHVGPSSEVEIGFFTQTAEGTYQVTFEAEFTILTTGASGTCMAVINCYGSGVVPAADGNTNAFNAALAIDTTQANDVYGSANMASAVANTTLTSCGGHVSRAR